MELTDFLQTGKNSPKLKADREIFDWAWSRMGAASMFTGPWEVWSRDPKITISKMDRRNKLIFCLSVQIHEN